MRRGLSLLLLLWTLLPLPPAAAEPSRMPAAPHPIAFGSRCAKSPIPCNRIDYFTASFHLADIVLLPDTDTRGFGATIGYGMSMSLFHRLEVGIGGTLSVWNQPGQGLLFQNGPALLNIKGVLFPLLRNPLPDTEFTFALHLQQQLRIPKFDGANDLGTLTPLTALRAVADKPFWRMGITGSLGFLLTPGRTDTELAASVRLHIPGMSRATVQGFGVLQGLFGSSRSSGSRAGASDRSRRKSSRTTVPTSLSARTKFSASSTTAEPWRIRQTVRKRLRKRSQRGIPPTLQRHQRTPVPARQSGNRTRRRSQVRS